ncbi:hypothetical protein ACOI1C_08195 [Bacillus sp. DJP31]|uniref:hypothetical protein n=1 Tax=Bacillus sp. DJP31 TaxID=3409789 RepID=UPI003BB64825
MKESIKLDEYIQRRMWEEREKLVDRKQEMSYSLGEEEEGFSSPVSSTSLEENRLLTEYMEQKNLFNVSNADPKRKKRLMLGKFFKMKRNQEVLVKLMKKESLLTLKGKVTAVGRDFVMLTDLKKRMWIPYSTIESANIPTGVPTFSNTHQHFLYDNDMRTKLVQSFGNTVYKKDALKQLFYEETLRTNLNTWRESWVELTYGNQTVVGKILEVNSKTIQLKQLRNKVEIPIKEVTFVKTIRFTQVVTKIVNWAFKI